MNLRYNVCMKYIIAIILWMLPVITGATITRSDYENKVYQIALKTVSNLENRYKTPIQFDVPLKIVFLSESDIGYTWCKQTNYGNTPAKSGSGIFYRSDTYCFRD